MRSVPLVPPAVALMVGIALARMWGAGAVLAWACVAAVTALAVGVWLLWRGWSKGVWLPMLVAVCAAGGLIECNADPALSPTHYSAFGNEQAFVVVRLCETPTESGKTLRAKAEAVSIEGQPACGTLRLYLRPDSTTRALRYADCVLLHVYPHFDHQSIYTTSDHLRLLARDSTSLRAHAEGLRQRLLTRMRRGPMGEKERGVVEALCLGWRGDLDAHLWQRWRRAGIVHLLCLSGLHVGLLAAAVGAAMRFVGQQRKGRTVRGAVQLVAIWGLVMVSGCAPATLRAALMFSLFVVSNILGRRTPKLNFLGLAAIITLCAQPALLFDVGWQLSYCAVGGILLAMPVVRLFANRVWQMAVVSTAAQVATLPVSVATFGSVPTGFLVANLVVVPLAGVLLVASIAYLALPCTSTAWVAGAMVDGVDWLTAWVAAQPWAMVEGVQPSALAVAALAVAVFFIFCTIKPLLQRYDQNIY